MFDQTLHTAGLQVDSDQWGLAVNAALAVVVLGTALVYVLVRGLGRAVDAAIERRIAVPTRLASRVLDVTTAALQLEKTH
ncbi:hypothetical protein [uncultured Friedmanniella sp.]|uniref:hypothetical protein n=1 Tax=uncultured Friedmanniella sp. TaxID=335381 RepID=UPI0035CB3B08